MTEVLEMFSPLKVLLLKLLLFFFKMYFTFPKSNENLNSLFSSLKAN